MPHLILIIAFIFSQFVFANTYLNLEIPNTIDDLTYVYNQEKYNSLDKAINEPGKVEFSNILEDIRHLKNAEKLDNPATSIEEQIRLRIQYGQNKDEIQKAISNNIEYKELTKDSNEVFDKIFEEQTAIVEKADKLNQAAEIGQTIFDVATGVGIAKIGVGTAKTVGKEAIEEIAEAGVKSGVGKTTQQTSEKIDDIVKYAKEHKGASRNGYNGGGKFENNKQTLPTKDAKGNDITYKEYDVNPLPKGSRDGERVVIGSNGKVYYTKDHYTTFIEVK